jgi:hypothetical protein
MCAWAMTAQEQADLPFALQESRRCSCRPPRKLDVGLANAE